MLQLLAHRILPNALRRLVTNVQTTKRQQSAMPTVHGVGFAAKRSKAQGTVTVLSGPREVEHPVTRAPFSCLPPPSPTTTALTAYTLPARSKPVQLLIQTHKTYMPSFCE